MILTGCSKTNKFELKSREIEKFFSMKEINELNRIVAFVDSIVLSNSPYSDVNNSYWYYLDSLAEFGFSLGRSHWLEIEPETKYDFLNKIDSVVFNKIWLTYYDLPYRLRIHGETITGTLPVSIDLNPQGVFALYIKELGNRNEFYNNFYVNCYEAGGLSPTANANFFSNNNKFDFNNSNNRLFVAVLILSQDGALDRFIE